MSDNSRTQWAIQKIVQRAINALAKEADGAETADDALERDVRDALANEHTLSRSRSLGICEVEMHGAG